MSNDISKLSKKAAEIVLSLPKSTRIRVVSHYDADGISAGGIICNALYREGYDFHATLMRNPFDKGLERLAKEENELIIFSDMGSGQIETMEKLGCKVIIFDHHQYLKSEVGKDVLQINANLCGIDGNYESSGATLSFFFAKTLNAENEDLSSLALAGAIGDKQHIGGIRGFNKEILESALEGGFLKEQMGIKLYGDSLFDALYFSIDPYYKGLSGDKDEIERILDKLNINKNTKIEDINKDKLIRLQSFLLFKLIKAGCPKNILDITIRKRYFSESLGCELERFADILDACGKNGYRGLGLSICLGDINAFKEAKTVEKEYKQKILEYLIELEKDETKEAEGMRYFYSESSSLGGVVAGIAMNYILDEKKPLFSIAKKEDEIHVSCRGNQNLVKKGLDLGGAMKKVTSVLGGHGGGHKIAAGATIALEKEKEFLEKVDKILVQQLKG
ncbi:single-stranded DNA-specific exonuclease [Thermoplasmatales archaeon SCGC AB-540-F20]|nr:single-stranded DNA-specific exonuclease [Thermoplasmatales archaeon SCGC AB-540-F20]